MVTNYADYNGLRGGGRNSLGNRGRSTFFVTPLNKPTVPLFHHDPSPYMMENRGRSTFFSFFLLELPRTLKEKPKRFSEDSD